MQVPQAEVPLAPAPAAPAPLVQPQAAPPPAPLALESPGTPCCIPGLPQAPITAPPPLPAQQRAQVKAQVERARAAAGLTELLAAAPSVATRGWTNLADPSVVPEAQVVTDKPLVVYPTADSHISPHVLQLVDIVENEMKRRRVVCKQRDLAMYEKFSKKPRSTASSSRGPTADGDEELSDGDLSVDEESLAIAQGKDISEVREKSRAKRDQRVIAAARQLLEAGWVVKKPPMATNYPIGWDPASWPDSRATQFVAQVPGPQAALQPGAGALAMPPMPGAPPQQAQLAVPPGREAGAPRPPEKLA